ncbi:hypothetical protein IFM89_006617 [Coptis chinensis]|uniref:Uncharacterized protein n=1 Tax=Coptis chinensis TaxID=261450 RepID=A0A835ICD1_9MAGN|nr:hypothetical protein IFM89_006617 [Coptis chinensis]
MSFSWDVVWSWRKKELGLSKKTKRSSITLTLTVKVTGAHYLSPQVLEFKDIINVGRTHTQDAILLLLGKSSVTTLCERVQNAILALSRDNLV